MKRLTQWPLDVSGIVRSSRFSLGKRVRARGVPAILLGAAGIVLAASAGRTLERTATIIPETLREAREFLLVGRSRRQPQLPP